MATIEAVIRLGLDGGIWTLSRHLAVDACGVARVRRIEGERHDGSRVVLERDYETAASNGLDEALAVMPSCVAFDVHDTSDDDWTWRVV